MQSAHYVIRCKLSRSAFSGERIFTVKQSDGRDYVGAAPLHYCRLWDGSELDAHTPPEGDSIDGLVNVNLLDNGGPTALVSVPTGEAITVPSNIVGRAEPETRSQRHVFS